MTTKLLSGAALALALSCAPTLAAGTRALPPTLYGVTVDNIAGIAATAAAIHALPKPIITRVVFDNGEQPAYYASAIQQLDAVGFTMGQILDSSDEKSVTVAESNARTDAYLATLGSAVDMWEIGNEVNGNWLGPVQNTAAKIYYSWKQAHAKGFKTALTLYYDDPCPSGAQWEMFNWAQANIPADMNAGLDYVLVSYYPQDCNGVVPSAAQWITVFQRLSAMFPRSHVGFGEMGTVNAKANEAKLESYIKFFYGLNPTVARSVGNFVGGDFDWYFKEQSAATSKASWQVLSATLGAL